MCEAPTDALRIEPRVGRLVMFFNHDTQLRNLRPVSLHGSCPVRAGRKRIAQRWYMWHALNERNTLGTALAQGYGDNKWKVDFLALDAAQRAAAEELSGGGDPCVDKGPWACTERGCPEPTLSCATLESLGGCTVAFDDVWGTPPPGTAGKVVAELCPRACAAHVPTDCLKDEV